MIVASIIDVAHIGQGIGSNGGTGAMLHFYSESDARNFCRIMSVQLPIPGGNPNALVYLTVVNTDTDVRWYYFDGLETEG